MSEVAGRGNFMIQVVPSILCHYAPAANVILYPWPREKKKRGRHYLQCKCFSMSKTVNILKAVKIANMS